jgi:hypothetical protein
MQRAMLRMAALACSRTPASGPASGRRLYGRTRLKPSIGFGTRWGGEPTSVSHSEGRELKPPYSAAPTSGAIPVARLRSASSLPRQPRHDRPTGAPSAVPAGIVTCGSPEMLAMHTRRMTRTRKDSSLLAG